MGELRVRRRKSRSPQIGDMRERIILQRRSLRAPVFNKSDPTHNYENIDTVWAKVETTEGKQLFNGVDPENVTTHEFCIRYRSDVTTETRVEYDGERYKIESVEDLDKRKRFTLLRCNLLGNEDVVSNR